MAPSHVSAPSAWAAMLLLLATLSAVRVTASQHMEPGAARHDVSRSKSSPAKITDADDEISVMLQRAVAEMLPANQESLRIMDEAVAGYTTMLNASSGRFVDIAYEPVGSSDRSWWPVAVHLQRTLLFAAAYVDTLSQHHGDETLRKNMELAFHTWIENDNGNVSAFHNSNWWWEEIGLPRLVGKCLVLMTTWLDSSDLRTWLEKAKPILARSHYTTSGTGTAANQVWRASSHALWALASSNASMLAQAYDVMHDAISVKDHGSRQDGIQADYSFHQHGPLLYTGWGYGAIFTTTVLDMDHMALNTTYQMSDELMEVFAKYVLQGQLLTTRGANFDYTACGRLMTYFSNNDSFGLNAGHYHYFAAFTPYENAFPRFAPPFLTPLAVDFQNLLPWVTARNSSIVGQFEAFAERLAGNPKYDTVSAHKHFFASDYSVHHRPGWAVTVRMYSTRTLNTECGNEEGKQGKTLADGVTNVYINGSDYENTYPAWNWSLVPGTTEHQRGFPFTCGEATGVNHTEYVGGVSDGLYGMAAMNFSRSGISVHKAWMFHDDFVVHMGSGAIYHAEPYTIATSLDQKRLLSDVHVGMVSGKPVLLQRGDHMLDNVTWLHHGNVLYVLQDSTADTMQHADQATGVRLGVFNTARNGSWADITQGSNKTLTIDLFGAFLPNLPANSQDSFAYHYTIVPNTELSDVDAALDRVSKSIVSQVNTRDLQSLCVQKDDGWILHAVFWQTPATLQATGCWSISTSSPVMLMVRQYQNDSGTLVATISVANPLADSNRTVKLTVKDVLLDGSACSHSTDRPNAGLSSTVVIDTSSDTLNTIGQTHSVTCQLVH